MGAKLKYGPFSLDEFDISNIKRFNYELIDNKVWFSTKKDLMEAINSIVAFKQRMCGFKSKKFKSSFFRLVLLKYHHRFINQEDISNDFGFIFYGDTDFPRLSVKFRGNWQSFSKNDIGTKITPQYALRRIFNDWWRDIRLNIKNVFYEERPLCWSCEESYRKEELDLDHVAPQHKTIKDYCISILLNKNIDLQEGFVSEFSKISDREYSSFVSDIYKEYKHDTKNGLFLLLCKDCHKVVTRKRTSSSS